jgi:Na+-transporting NADH:ubiquinone oxidoreductase subunit C
MQQDSTAYTFMFAAGICLVCSLFVSGAAVALKDKQEANKVLDRQKKVLTVAGLIEDGASPDPTKVESLFTENIEAKLVDFDSGTYAEGDARTYDQRKAASDPEQSEEAPPNEAKVKRIPEKAVVYCVKKGGGCDQYILPIQGAGLWSTLYGYLSVDSDGNTIRGITFYEHGETPGLGGEVDNPKWKASWNGRKIGGDEVKIHVKKGKAGSAAEDPYAVDGLLGAMFMSNGVTHALAFWLGDEAFGPYLENIKSGKVKG